MNFLTLNVNCIGSSSKKRTLQVYSVCTSLLLLFRNILLLGWLEGRTQAHRQKEIGSHTTLTAASVEFDLPDRHFYSNLKMALLDHVTKRNTYHRLHWLLWTPRSGVLTDCLGLTFTETSYPITTDARLIRDAGALLAQ